MYRELASSTHPLSAHRARRRLGIHANTVRLHLERLREAGLVDVEAVHRGTVGRPQHVYTLGVGRTEPRIRPPELHAARGAARRAGRARRCRRRGSHGHRPEVGRRSRSPNPFAIVHQGAHERARAARVRPGGRRRRRRRLDRLPPLPVPGTGGGVSRARLQPAPRHLRRCREVGGRGKRRRLRDVVRPRPVSRRPSRSGILQIPEFSSRRHMHDRSD